MHSRVCLITPPSPFLLDERVFMNLGILRVAAVLEQAGYPVELLDLSGISNYLDAVHDHVSHCNTRLFGITATTPQLPAAANISSVIRKNDSNARVILGGPHVTCVNAAHKGERKRRVSGRAGTALERLLSLFDVLVAGDGERAIFAAISDNPPKVIDADDTRSGLFILGEALSELPTPARHLVDVDSYRYTIEGVRAISLIAQLGCPFGCGFCGGRLSPTFRRVRMRSIDSIIHELTTLYETYGFRGFMFYDDELNVNPGMLDLMHAITETAKRLGVEFRLRGFVRADLFNDEQADSMYEAGFRWLLAGHESGSPRILKNMNKKTTREDNTRSIQIARRHGLKVKALMSLGHPGETELTIRESKEWLLETRPDEFDLTIITVYPGTPYHDSAVPLGNGAWRYTINGDNLYSFEVDYTKVSDYYKGDPNGGYTSYVYTDELTPTDLVHLRDSVERDVRELLQLRFTPSNPAIVYEHSMGQMGRLPERILRSSGGQQELRPRTMAAD
jgi:anaerobic magnesium-protoporphyrin IX monomethyl ester cyclase